MTDISFPKFVSSDGREIWDWATRISLEVEKLAKIRELTTDIRRIGTVCGDCDLWMKSRLCPREVNINGRRRGPSMNASICGKFAEVWSATERRERLHLELQTLSSHKQD